MAEGVALVLASPVYGKPKVKAISAICGTNVSNVSINAGDGQSASGSGTQRLAQVSPGTAMTVACTMPSDSTSGSWSYYNGSSTPSNGNYRYYQTTTYTFSGWAGTGVAGSANKSYSFEMPSDDVVLTASGTVSYGQASVQYAIGLSVVNASTSYLTYAQINGSNYSTSGTIYRWPSQGNITVTGVAKSATTDGPYYTDGNSTARSGAYRWYVLRTFSLNRVVGPDGTTYGAKSVNPASAATYSVYGTYADATVSKVAAQSRNSQYLITSYNQTKYTCSFGIHNNTSITQSLLTLGSGNIITYVNSTNSQTTMQTADRYNSAYGYITTKTTNNYSGISGRTTTAILPSQINMFFALNTTYTKGISETLNSSATGRFYTRDFSAISLFLRSWFGSTWTNLFSSQSSEVSQTISIIFTQMYDISYIPYNTQTSFTKSYTSTTTNEYYMFNHTSSVTTNMKGSKFYNRSLIVSLLRTIYPQMGNNYYYTTYNLIYQSYWSISTAIILYNNTCYNYSSTKTLIQNYGYRASWYW